MALPHLFYRAIPIGLCSAVVFHPALASAKENKRAVCSAAYTSYKSALDREKASHLLEARGLYQTCAQATSCVGLVPKCTAALQRLATAMSSVVPLVVDDSGAPRVDVQVKVDGEPITSKVEGHAFPVEVGVHEFTFSADGGVFATQRVVVAEGERNRQLLAKLHGSGTGPQAHPLAAPAPGRDASSDRVSEGGPHSEPSHDEGARGVMSQQAPSNNGEWALPHSALPYVIGGVGLAGLGGAVLFNVWGNKDNDAAIAQCNRNCPQSVADHIRTMYIEADISFGAGVVALGVATWMFARSRSVEEKAQPHSALTLDVQSTRSGALATVKGAF